MRIIASLALISVFGVCSAIAYIIQSPVPVPDWFSNPAASFALARGENPNPVTLSRPAIQPLSAMALLGQQIFNDTSLSSSGQLSCAACHSAANAYAPANNLPAQYGGPALSGQGVRAVPSLMYLAQQPNFYIGPDPGGDPDTPAALPQLASAATKAARATKTALSTAQTAANIVPEGGLFWDGRVNTLQDQAMGPLLNPFELDGGSLAVVAAKLRAAPYAGSFTRLFGALIFKQPPQMLVSEALFAVARYQVEDPSFHPFSSKYDAWLEGKARLTSVEMRGYVLFNDPAKGDCAACHLDQPTTDGQPPLFTDHQYEALGAPRNPDLVVNKNPSYYDLGICGPYRTDLAAQTQYCGMFLTPTLRNAATRHAFFHNGVFHTLRQVLDFYDLRDTDPAKIYPRDEAGHVETFDDLPFRYRANIDTADPPLNRTVGQLPALRPGEEDDIIAYLKTLTDGYGAAGTRSGA